MPVCAVKAAAKHARDAASHLRLAHPSNNDGIPILRRGYNYVGGIHPDGLLDAAADADPVAVLSQGFWERHLGGDPAVHRAIGVGHGLERLAMLRYGIDDIRKIDGARVA